MKHEAWLSLAPGGWKNGFPLTSRANDRSFLMFFMKTCESVNFMLNVI